MSRAQMAILAAALLLAGCSPENRMADGKILCDLDGSAFHVRPGAGDTSFIKPLPAANSVCSERRRISP